MNHIYYVEFITSWRVDDEYYETTKTYGCYNQDEANDEQERLIKSLRNNPEITLVKDDYTDTDYYVWQSPTHTYHVNVRQYSNHYYCTNGNGDWLKTPVRGA